MMTLAEKVEYWVDIAKYDLQTATAMFKSRRYLYTVFMCEQALEKLLKSLYIAKVDENFARDHKLLKLTAKMKNLVAEYVERLSHDIVVEKVVLF